MLTGPRVSFPAENFDRPVNTKRDIERLHRDERSDSLKLLRSSVPLELLRMQGFTADPLARVFEEGPAGGANGFRIGNLSSNQLTPGAVKQFPGVFRFYQENVGFLRFADSPFRRGYRPHTERNP